MLLFYWKIIYSLKIKINNFEDLKIYGSFLVKFYKDIFLFLFFDCWQCLSSQFLMIIILVSVVGLKPRYNVHNSVNKARVMCLLTLVQYIGEKNFQADLISALFC